MRQIEATGRTVDEAKRNALESLGLEADRVEFEILDEGARALFGLLGGRQAKVRAWEKEQPQQPAAPSLTPEPEQAVPEEPVQEQQAADVPEASEDEAQGRAAAFLTELTQRMDCPATLEIRKEEDHLFINLSGERAGTLIGHRGETLDAMQYLTSLVVNRGNTDAYIRVMLDTENYRQKREEALMQLAERMANKALKLRRKVVLEPMNPYERRIMHTALQDIPGVETHSEGSDPFRRVVITVAGSRY